MSPIIQATDSSTTLVQDSNSLDHQHVSFEGRKLQHSSGNDSGTIMSEILVDVLSTLDVMNVISMDQHTKPFLLLDGHQSRLKIPCLEYISTAEDH